MMTHTHTHTSSKRCSLRVTDVAAAAVVKVTGCVLLAAELGPDSSLPVIMETRRR